MYRARKLGVQFLGTALLFSVAVGLGTSLVLLIASCAGYLPYSDRPGPGWWGRVHWPDWTEIGTYLGFAPWFAYFCLFFGVGLFLLSLVLGFASTPRWLNRIVGGVIAALAAALAVAGSGWYLALAPIGPNSALAIGFLYGAFLFPRFVARREKKLPTWLRAVSVTTATILFALWIAWPFLPKKPVPGMAVMVNRVTPGETPVDWHPTQYLRVDTWKELGDLHLDGELHGGVQSSTSGDGQQIEVVIIVLQPIGREYRLPIPRSGHVVYVLRNGTFEAHPAIMKKDGRTIVLRPGADPKWDGGEMKMKFDFEPFTWYPTIPR